MARKGERRGCGGSPGGWMPRGVYQCGCAGRVWVPRDDGGGVGRTTNGGRGWFSHGGGGGGRGRSWLARGKSRGEAKWEYGGCGHPPRRAAGAGRWHTGVPHARTPAEPAGVGAHQRSPAAGRTSRWSWWRRQGWGGGGACASAPPLVSWCRRGCRPCDCGGAPSPQLPSEGKKKNREEGRARPWRQRRDRDRRGGAVGARGCGDGDWV